MGDFPGRNSVLQLAVLAGAGSILEIYSTPSAIRAGSAHPTPSYAGFWTDLETRDQLKVVPVHCSQRRRVPALRGAPRPRGRGSPLSGQGLAFHLAEQPLWRGLSHEVEDLRVGGAGASTRVRRDLRPVGLRRRPFTSCATLRPHSANGSTSSGPSARTSGSACVAACSSVRTGLIWRWTACPTGRLLRRYPVDPRRDGR